MKCMLFLVSLAVGLGAGAPTDPAGGEMLGTFLKEMSNCSRFPVGGLEQDEDFRRECKNMLTPELVSNHSKETLQSSMLKELDLDAHPLLCFGALQSVVEVCAGTVQGSKPVPNLSSAEPTQFCANQRNHEIPKDCGIQHCEVLRVLSVSVLQNSSLCQDTCTKHSAVLPACSYLSTALAALFPVSAAGGNLAPETGEPAESSGTGTEDSTTGEGTGVKNETPAVEGDKNTNSTTKGLQQKVTTPATTTPGKETTLAETKPVAPEKKTEDEPEPPSDPPVQPVDEVSEAGDEAVEDNGEESLVDKMDEGKLKDNESQDQPAVMDTMDSGVFSEDNSDFLAVFVGISFVFIVAYLLFHNKQKILALILEGRRRQGSRRRSAGREYRKLDATVEDSIEMNRETNLRQVIY